MSDCQPSLSIYETLAGSKQTTEFVKLLGEYPELVLALNTSAGPYTIFSPTDAALIRLATLDQQHTRDFLDHHIIPHTFPISRILSTPTIPTLLQPRTLNGPQRLRLGLGFRGLTVNFHSHVIAANILATNGIVHVIDRAVPPPPPTSNILESLPGEFSTLELALLRTGLARDINVATETTGRTIFAPNNQAFRSLGRRTNAFLFSKGGKRYLHALLSYHIVANETLYSNALYRASSPFPSSRENKLMATNFPKGYINFALPTLLHGRSLSVDIVRYGGLISMTVDGSARVSVQDLVAMDGVMHAINGVLIPAKIAGSFSPLGKHREGMDVEELKERLEPLIDGDCTWERRSANLSCFC